MNFQSSCIPSECCHNLTEFGQPDRVKNKMIFLQVLFDHFILHVTNLYIRVSRINWVCFSHVLKWSKWFMATCSHYWVEWDISICKWRCVSVLLLKYQQSKNMLFLHKSEETFYFNSNKRSFQCITIICFKYLMLVKTLVIQSGILV